MLTYNPFADLSAFISPVVMQVYVVLMVILVAAGTILDIMHKQSAKYFFENARKAQEGAKRPVGSAKKAGLAVTTLTNEVLTSAEFQNTRRRISHLFTMYGFVLRSLFCGIWVPRCCASAVTGSGSPFVSMS
jgi:xanthine/uracil permease